MHKIIRLPDVMKYTGLARSTIYKMMATNSFPGQIALGSKSVGWVEAEIEQWIKERISQSQIQPKNLHGYGEEYGQRQ